MNLPNNLAAARGSGLTVAQLRAAACADPRHGALNAQLICSILGLSYGRDMLSLQLALFSGA